MFFYLLRGLLGLFTYKPYRETVDIGQRMNNFMDEIDQSGMGVIQNKVVCLECERGRCVCPNVARVAVNQSIFDKLDYEFRLVKQTIF
jgi:hypothetical protein